MPQIAAVQRFLPFLRCIPLDAVIGAGDQESVEPTQSDGGHGRVEVGLALGGQAASPARSHQAEEDF